MCVCQCVWAYACAPCVYITVHKNNVENAMQAQKVDFFIKKNFFYWGKGSEHQFNGQELERVCRLGGLHGMKSAH